MTPLRPTSLSAGHRPLADINVTPLVDVMLVLLVVFMITAPMLAAGLRVDLPKAATAEPLPPAEPIVVTVDRDGGVSVGRDPVTRETLAAAVAALAGGDNTRLVHVRGDRAVAYGEVVSLIDLLAADGFTRIALVSQRGDDGAAAERTGSTALAAVAPANGGVRP